MARLVHWNEEVNSDAILFPILLVTDYFGLFYALGINDPEGLKIIKKINVGMPSRRLLLENKSCHGTDGVKTLD